MRIFVVVFSDYPNQQTQIDASRYCDVHVLHEHRSVCQERSGRRPAHARDMNLFFRYANNVNARTTIAQQSLNVSPYAPVAIAALVDGDWKTAREKAKVWEQASQHPLAFTALGHRYLQKRTGRGRRASGVFWMVVSEKRKGT
jgi:hypothetical protein